MKTGECWDLKNLSDDELIRGLQLIVVNERRSIARVVAHLAEVEARKLHLRVGCSSLFDYCLRRLALSEGEAFRRVTAARLARRFPVIFELLAEGDIHLCALTVLRDHLTQANHRELLEEASRKTKIQVKELVARRFPLAELSSTLRRLPAPITVQSERLPGPPPKELAPAPSSTAQQGTAPSQLHPAVPVPRPAPHQTIEPLREDRYRLQLNTSSELKRKLELARTSRRFLQFHHEHAWAHGGKSETSNVRILCAAHNQFLAEVDFGKHGTRRTLA